MKKLLTLLICPILIAAVFIGCSAGGYPYPQHTPNDEYYFSLTGGNSFEEIVENPFVETDKQNVSSIALTVNTASYSQIRRYIDNNMPVPKDAVKIEEIVNYFNYDYSAPQSNEPFSLNGAIIDTPWNSQTKLLTVGLKAKTINNADVRNNLVFLIDISGSMNGADRLDLAKQSFIALTETLTEKDRVSIVTYAGTSSIVLNGAKGNEQQLIKDKINSLSAGGLTAGASGINLAYECAFANRIEGDNSRIIIATDGDFNVGAGAPDALKELILQNRRQGVYLSVLGFGFGNLSDINLQEITASGQGAYAYIDSIDEARRVMISNQGSILHIVAEEAKAQIEFNKNSVFSFRLIGYENKQITDEEWNSSDAPAGAISSGTVVTAMYEIILKDGYSVEQIADFTVKYHNPGAVQQAPPSTISLNGDYLNPVQESGNIINYEDRMFISALIETGLILRNSDYKGRASYQNILTRLNSLNCVTNDVLKAEFKQLISKLALN